MIVCSLGYGYVAKYVLKELSSLGVLGLGVSSNKEIFLNTNENFIPFNRDNSAKAIKISTNILITAPSYNKGCPVFKNYSSCISNSNIKTITYISTTGVYGNHNGSWVDEKSTLKAQNVKDKNRIIAENQWIKFAKMHNIKLNIMRVASIYGPGRIKTFNGKNKIIIKKKEHFFSRIHIYDLARAISNIMLNGYNNNTWNLADNHPSTRDEFLLEVIRIKKIKKYKVELFEDYKDAIPKSAKKFWLNNKKVSNRKLNRNLNFFFIYPSYIRGLISLKDSI